MPHNRCLGLWPLHRWLYLFCTGDPWVSDLPLYLFIYPLTFPQTLGKILYYDTLVSPLLGPTSSFTEQEVTPTGFVFICLIYRGSCDVWFHQWSLIFHSVHVSTHQNSCFLPTDHYLSYFSIFTFSWDGRHNNDDIEKRVSLWVKDPEFLSRRLKLPKIDPWPI